MIELFKNNGYTTESYHFNDSKFYARGTIHKSFGYSKYNGLIDKNINVHDAEKDTIFMTNEKLYKSIVKDNKFMSFIITYSGHMPYSTNNYLCKATLDGNIKGNEEVECLKAQAKETDNMFKLLIDNLKRDNKLKDTVIIIWSDHYAYGIYDTDRLYKLKDTDDINLLTKTPFIIWNSELNPVTVEKINSSVDVLPTIANMFGLTNNYEYYMGSDIFDNNYNGLVYFNNFDFYDGTNYYKNDELVKGDISKLDINKINKNIYEKVNINEKIFIINYFKK
jgi:phosphoglycerol transferase MdoB-like AlkP superfamily enzyme